MEKYPIISMSGNKYLIEITRWIDTIDDSYSKIELYIYEVKSKFFIKKYNKVYYKKYMFNSPEFHDYILATKNAVEVYESSNNYYLNLNDEENKKLFKKWNGVIK